MTQRLHKLLAEQGLGSRRCVEDMIRGGKIEVNGNIAQIGDKASLGDNIRVDGKILKLRREIPTVVLLCHKPCGFLVTHDKHSEKPTVFSLLPKPRHGRWVAVGRLDINTSGLLIVCNDGELANRLMHPSYEIEREYHVRVSGRTDTGAVDNLRRGVMLNGKTAKFDLVELIKTSDSNSWYRVILREGRNREVRRLWESQGLIVNRLRRVRFGSVHLDVLSGAWRELRAQEVHDLYDSVGLEHHADVLHKQLKTDRA